MRIRAWTWGLLLLAVAASARADWYTPPDTLDTGPTLDFGYSVGGDDLNQPPYTGSQQIDGHYNAGEGLSVGGGMLELFGGDSGFGLKQELGAWLQIPFTTGGGGNVQQPSKSMNFDHSYLNLLGFYHFGQYAVGTGSTYQTHVQLVDGAVGGGTLSDFENAHGWILMFQTGAFSFRYTRISYKLRFAPSSLDGSNLGLYVTYQFF